MFQNLKGWQLNTVVILLTTLLTNGVVATLALLMYGNIAVGTFPVATGSGLIIATLLVIGTSVLRARAAKNYKHRLEVAVDRAQGNLSVAVETTQMLIWEFDLRTSTLDFVQGNLSWLELQPVGETTTIQDWLELIHPEDVANFTQRMRAALPNGSPDFEVEYRIANQHGGWSWVHTRGRVKQRDAKGMAQVAVGGSINITKQKQIQEALREQEFLLSESQRVGQIGSYSLDLVANTFTCSSVMEAIFGLAPDAKKTTKLWADLLHPEDRAALLSYIQHDVIEPRKAFNREYRIVRSSDGVTRWIWGRGELSYAPDGQPVRMIGTVLDITERKQAEVMLREREKEFFALSTMASDWFWKQDAQFRFTEFSGAFSSDFTPPKDTLGKTRRELRIRLSPEEWAAHEAMVNAHLPLKDFEYSISDDSGEVRWYSVNGEAIFDDAGKFMGYHGTGRNITELKNAQARMQLAANVLTFAREGITITDADGTIVEVNDTFGEITGYSRAEVLGKNPRIFNSGQHPPEFYDSMWNALAVKGHWTGEIWNRRKNGQLYPAMLTISAAHDSAGKTLNYVALYSDITDIKTHQRELERIAHYDPLTGLPNRLLMGDRLQHAIAQCQRRHQSVAVVYLDLDNIKAVNDTHGHDAGDTVLVTLSVAMKDALREGDTLARMGGDEFVAVLVDLENAEDCIPIIQRLLEAAGTPVAIPASGQAQADQTNPSVQVSASIGVTFYPQDNVDADGLLRHADQAMYQAKQSGKNRYHLFDIANDAAIQGHHENLKRVRSALEHGEFVLYYQPKVNMRTGAVVGAEALIRWQHPERGLLSPGLFLHIIENQPLSIELGEWVIATALAQMSVWQNQGLELLISVNIGALQLQQEDFSQRLAGILQRYPQVAPKSLQLEILETSALENLARVTAVMQACRSLGVGFALDDFGTGYSSLTHLKHLPAQTLKIDQSFVRDMTDDTDDLAIVQGVIQLAGIFQREVIAEGVETKALGDLLLSIGCELAQGYGVARPMPAQDIHEWVQHWQLQAVWTA